MTDFKLVCLLNNQRHLLCLKGEVNAFVIMVVAGICFENR